ncbi:MAG: alpha/beta hydrolase [Deltaproteobacteria bacterium]|nr:alpha/beta hydrolase [Deltaproteobacteria bacterium]MBW2052083.1 alpha/beta hydrolase [Deltaproteobacteria bacterium]MBW2140704.1 alpha/beta hydrolase [Deltaproteobacteria bacterium]MBW2322342.1 alpha/beta hydrolase [Deltaproteobacteria bacterium]
MIDLSEINYSELDVPQILSTLFYPRPEFGSVSAVENAEDLLIPVDGEAEIGARAHVIDKEAPNILFFHGNGEIVSDYDDMGALFNRLQINFLPVDYRGYGRSTGSPTITFMMRDCHVIFHYLRNWLIEKNHTGPFIVMGRSLGSASALELAGHYRQYMDGLIVESGFASLDPLFNLLGIAAAFSENKKKGLSNIAKIETFEKPTLVIHAEYDHIIPFSNGEALYNACGAENKTFLKIPGANHNDIFFHGMSEYMEAVTALVKQVENKGLAV